MAAIAVSETHINAVKKALRDDFLYEKSSHLSEALAAALGYKTHAALLADLPKLAEDPPIVMLSTGEFVSRLQEFGYPRDDEFDFDYLDQHAEVIRTFSLQSGHVEYESDREKAWRNIVVCAVNEGIRAKAFSLRKDDNRWPGARPVHPRKGPDYRVDDPGICLSFKLPNGIPAQAKFRDIGWSELEILVAVSPAGDRFKEGYTGFEAGDAFARGWLERERGAYLNTATNLFNCRKPLVGPLAALEVECCRRPKTDPLKHKVPIQN